MLTLRRTIDLFAPLAALALLASTALGVRPPEPSPVPQRWQLDVKAGELRTATVEVDGEARHFMYITYTVTNNSGEDVLFAPIFELATDEGHLLRAGRGVSARVTEEIIARQKNEFLEDQISITDQILQGKENARDGIAIWPVEDYAVDRITVYAAGFSGETATVDLPRGGQMTVRKQYRLRYDLPGSLEGFASKPLPRSHRPDWIMR